MTGKTDIVSVSNLPSHLSQPSRRTKKAENIPAEFVPILTKRQRQVFAPKSCSFRAKRAEEKRDFQPHRTSHPLTAVLPPVGRFVASQGGGRVRIPPSPFGRVLGSFSVRRKRSRRKGRRRGRPHPGHFCPQCGQFHRVSHRGRKVAFSVGGGVENRNDPAITGKAAGSWQKFKEESQDDK